MRTGSARARAQVWSIRDAGWRCKVHQGASGAVHCAWSPDGSTLVVRVPLSQRSWGAQGALSAGHPVTCARGTGPLTPHAGVQALEKRPADLPLCGASRSSGCAPSSGVGAQVASDFHLRLSAWNLETRAVVHLKGCKRADGCLRFHPSRHLMATLEARPAIHD